MSTVVTNEYAVDHTDVWSFREIKDKYLPKNATDRFQWMREENAAAIKDLNEKHVKEIEREEATIEFLRHRITEFENGQALKELERRVKYEKGLNQTLTSGQEAAKQAIMRQYGHIISEKDKEIQNLNTKVKNCVENFRDLETENNNLSHKYKAQHGKYVEVGEILRRALCSLADEYQKGKRALNAEGDTWDKGSIKPVGTCPVCLEEKYFYNNFGLCANQHGLCWTCIDKLPKVLVNVTDPVTGGYVRDPATGGIETKKVCKCPKCRIETEKWASCTLNLKEYNELYQEHPMFFGSLKLDEKMVNLFGRFKELNAQAIVY